MREMKVQAQIESKLKEAFSPFHLEVVNESHMHNVPDGMESHFKVTLVSEAFRDKTLVARHRAVNASLKEELENYIHALALHTMTPEEWYEKGGQSPESPPCLGGGKSDDA